MDGGNLDSVERLDQLMEAARAHLNTRKGPAKAPVSTDRLAELVDLLRDLRDLARETAAELSREELDPDRLTELMNRREATFASLQEAHAKIQGMAPSESGGIAVNDELKRLVRELLELERANMETMRNRLAKLRSEIDQVRMRRRSLAAYGWVDPVHAPRGAFIDTVQG